MTPEKALELVGRYARLTKEIKVAGLAIQAGLSACPGISGLRQNILNQTAELMLTKTGREEDLHLTQWYTPDIGEYGGCTYLDVGTLEQEECPDCYAAHLAIQQRKQARKSLGHVKAAMSRDGAL